jgi:hypothetical protein
VKVGPNELYAAIVTRDERGRDLREPLLWLRRAGASAPRDEVYAGPYIVDVEQNRPIESVAEALLAGWGFSLLGGWRVLPAGTRAWIQPVNGQLPPKFEPKGDVAAVLDIIDAWTVQTVKGLRAVRALRAAVRSGQVS